MKLLKGILFSVLMGMVCLFSFSSLLQAAEGEYLTAIAGCKGCHTKEEGATPFAGGHALKTPFGVFYTPNITPDEENGIGNWTEDQFVQAVKHGIRPDGSYYFPSFPYPSYAKMTDEDAKKIFGFLKTVAPSDIANKEHEISAPFSWRWLQAFWRVLFFDDTPIDPEERGKYLTHALGHCSECHTPRNQMGGFIQDRFMAGSLKSEPAGKVPNITPHADGIGEWSRGDLISFFESGMKPNFDDVQGEMGIVISQGTSRLSLEDRAAMADYLLSLPAIATPKD
ncbi:c-type cytochrome [Sneathiella sp. P13V-1]|uniref:c-type cytochrome n=1 Tax=Sneathiella sp. P13V-1 TaxID=2697366 RepID=UPI00187B777B|nr:cytochrome c [Sneathiella sp. P13V-1]MBE7637433.1 c-type cytochrome [Sneathiella sp. P13V-1]